MLNGEALQKPPHSGSFLRCEMRKKEAATPRSAAHKSRESAASASRSCGVAIFFILPFRMYVVNVHRSIVGMLGDAAKPSDQRRKLLVFKVYRRFRFLHQKLAEGADWDFNAFRSN